jgi:glutathione S-transferase
MIKLIQFPSKPERASYSPFCLKLETFFKVAEVPYENQFSFSPKGTKKKMPMIDDQGELIEDSSLVIEHLKSKHKIGLDAHLTAEQKAVGRAFKWLCEKSLIDIIVHFRWNDSQNWPKFRDVIFAGAPWLIKVTVANVMAKSIKKTMYNHGTGRFTDVEKLKIFDDNLRAISDYLGTKKYFFGDKISSHDVTLFSFLVQSRSRGVVPQLEGRLEKFPNLVKLVAEIQKAYWPEWTGDGE